MSRARRAEVRQQKEEADRVSRETAREQRRREREAKEEQEAKEAEEKERKEREKEERAKQRGYVDYLILTMSCSSVVDIRTRQHNRLSSPATNGAILLHHPGSNLSSANGSARGSRSRGSRTPAGDDWELDCEICHRRGINLVSRLSVPHTAH